MRKLLLISILALDHWTQFKKMEVRPFITHSSVEDKEIRHVLEDKKNDEFYDKVIL